MAEDKSILTAAGENNSLAVAGELGAWVVYQFSEEFLSGGDLHWGIFKYPVRNWK